jgi:hypothetical protein
MPTYRKMIKDLRAELDASERRMKALKSAIEGLTALEELEARLATSPKRDTPGTSSAVLRILEESKEPLTDTEIIDVMKDREWLPKSKDPLNALRATLSRLSSQGLIERTGRQTYIFIQNSDAPNGELGASDLLLNQGGPMDPP